MIGTRIAHYEITAKLGEGGMGEVYRATDTKLNRDVALKILPEQFASDSQRMGRFQREAEVLASLDHANIGAIYGIEDVGSTKALVLQLIEGPTLADRVAEGPIRADEARPIAVQIAEALETAHEKGIIHRDLKPANIKITPENQVKVLDFGLAKAMEPEIDSASSDVTHSPTLTMGATQGGVILGTAAYMSPEQARGKPADRRSDIWAFGAICFEMLTGRQAFAGDTLTDILGAVVRDEPGVEAIPAGWRRLITRCLRKDASLRLQHIGDARIELLEYDESEPGAPPTASRSHVTALVLTAIVGAALGGAAVWNWTGPAVSPPSPVTNLSIQTPGPVDHIALSPDGRSLAFESQARLYLRRLDDPTSHLLAGSDNPAGVVFSPDSRWLAYVSGGYLYSVPVDGGDPTNIAPITANVPGAAWGPDGTILLSINWTSGLRSVNVDTGEMSVITEPDREANEVGHWWPRFLPGGRRALFSIWTTAGSLNRSRMAIVDLASGEITDIGEGAAPIYLSSGHLAFYRAGQYVLAPFDTTAGSVTGAAVPFALPIRKESPRGGKLKSYSVSNDGTLMYVPGDSFSARGALAIVDRAGARTELPFEAEVFEDIRFSPDGRMLAAALIREGEYDLWLYDLERRIAEPLTRRANNFSPTWSPDGRTIAFGTTRAGSFDVFALDLDGDRDPFEIFSAQGDFTPKDWSTDGETLLVNTYSEEGGQDVSAVSVRSREHRPVSARGYDEHSAVFSPDARWVAFVSHQSGQPEIYVRPLSGSGPPVRVSAGGATFVRWARESNEIFFIKGDRMMVVQVGGSGDQLRFGPTRPLFPTAGFESELSWDVTSDGQRFIMVRPEAAYPENEVRVVLNWFEEVKRMFR